MPTSLEASPKRAGPYRDSLGKRAANYAPLSPLTFLPKAAGRSILIGSPLSTAGGAAPGRRPTTAAAGSRPP